MKQPPTAVYHLLDCHDELLYVGITTKPDSRLRQHIRFQPWSAMIARMRIQEWLTERRQAEEVERLTIRLLRPPMNIAHLRSVGGSQQDIADSVRLAATSLAELRRRQQMAAFVADRARQTGRRRRQKRNDPIYRAVRRSLRRRRRDLASNDPRRRARWVKQAELCVSCPTCGAEPTYRCRSLTTGAEAAKPHSARRKYHERLGVERPGFAEWLRRQVAVQVALGGTARRCGIRRSPASTSPACTTASAR